MQVELVFWTDGDRCALYRRTAALAPLLEHQDGLELLCSGRSFGDVVEALKGAIKEAQEG